MLPILFLNPPLCTQGDTTIRRPPLNHHVLLPNKCMQLVYVTGRPTPETYRRFVGAGDGTECIDAGMFRTEREEDANNADTYDLVCCSLRVLEEAPVVEEELVGKGDDWEDDEGEFLRMDLPDAAVTYVDTAEGLNEMGEYLREVKSICLFFPVYYCACVKKSKSFSFFSWKFFVLALICRETM